MKIYLYYLCLFAAASLFMSGCTRNYSQENHENHATHSHITNNNKDFAQIVIPKGIKVIGISHSQYSFYILTEKMEDDYIPTNKTVIQINGYGYDEIENIIEIVEHK